MKHTAADILTLDRTLARYGPETQETRETLHHAVEHRREITWPTNPSRAVELVRPDVTRSAEGVVGRIRGLSPQNDDQRWLQSRALDLGEDLLEARWVVLILEMDGPFEGLIKISPDPLRFTLSQMKQ